MLLREINHNYLDWKGAEGHCRVRIYAGTEGSANLPIVILTEPNDNDGPSVTNTIEQIAAEVLTRYLPGQDGLQPPFVLVEHYPIDSRAATTLVITIRSLARRSPWSHSTVGRLVYDQQVDDAACFSLSVLLTGATSAARRSRR